MEGYGPGKSSLYLEASEPQVPDYSVGSHWGRSVIFWRSMVCFCFFFPLLSSFLFPFVLIPKANPVPCVRMVPARCGVMCLSAQADLAGSRKRSLQG
jgi:hypothetical protein